jgi:hypothetical protein
MMYFFDWLSIKQTHKPPLGRPLPIVCKIHSTHTDTETGENFDTRTRAKFEGSYSTSISVRCDGHTVEVSGNPSRVNRLDNLFGLDTLRDCVLVYNRILREYGLPPFTPAILTDAVTVSRHTRTMGALPVQSDHVTSEGAIIQELHVTRNYSVGQGNEGKFYRAMGSFKHRQREPKLYRDGITWGEGSRRLYFGFYSKGVEFDLPRVKSKLRGLLESEQITQDDYDYYENVKSYAITQGIVRLEYKLKNNWLRDNNLRFYIPSITAEHVSKKLNIAEKWVENMSVSKVSYNNIAEQLVEIGACKERASRFTESVFLRWLHGMDIGLAPSQLKVHRKRLLSLGIDIAMPCDVTSLRVHIRTDEISLSDCPVPDWYRAAA